MKVTDDIDLPLWGVVLIGIAASLVVGYVFWCLLLMWARRAYKNMVKDNKVSVDHFVRQSTGPETGFSCLKCVIMHRAGTAGMKARTEALPLVAEDSDVMPGMKRTRRADNEGEATKTDKKKAPLVIGTIRMGFGHHRIAYAATSWGLDDVKDERDVYFHDLLNIESKEAQMIRDADKMYSKGSRMASELGGVFESIWGGITNSGDEDSLRVTYQTGEHLLPVIDGLDKDSPIIASHSLVAAAAVAAGFKNVINLVIDNHAQWFVVVPQALNLVQGPTNYHQFLKMGVPPEQIKMAGHWCPRELVEGVPEACKRRVARVDAKKPLRILIPVGGAGAQRRYVTALVAALAPLVKAGTVQLWLNAGDHGHMKEAFMQVLDENHLTFELVSTFEGLQKFKDGLLQDESKEPERNVTLFAYDEYFPAVTTTDILCNVADVLACKPSEMAFYCVPKLMIRRVGDHEMFSAYRASELGDGTMEAREVKDAVGYINCMLDTPEFLKEMNKAIETNQKNGVYDGCKNAVKLALEMAK